MTTELRPWFNLKIFLIALLFLVANGLFYGGLFFQQEEGVQIIAPVLDFDEQAPQVISGISHKEIEVNQQQILFVGDQIQNRGAELVEIQMGQNQLRLGPNTTVEILELNFHPQSSYAPIAPAIKLELKQGQLWVNAFDLISIESETYNAHLFHSIGFIESIEQIHRMRTFLGVMRIQLKNSARSILTEFNLPNLKQIYFSAAQLTDDYAFLKLSKLKKELKMSSVPQEDLQDPWVSLYAFENTSLQSNNSQPIYSRMNYRFKNIGNWISRLLAFEESTEQKIWLKKGNNLVRYWLGGVANGQNPNELEQVKKDWKTLKQSVEGSAAFQSWSAQLFFELPWLTLGSADFELKNLLFKEVLSQDGPVALRALLRQAQLSLATGQLGRAQRFTENWLACWQKQDLDQHSNELLVQFEMLQQLGLYYPEEISSVWLTLLDQAAELLMSYLGREEEFELALTQARLAQVSALIQVHRYDFAKNYLRSSYQKLPIATGQQLSASEEVFFELGKLLAQRIEYAEITFNSAALPIDEDEFARFVLQAKQSDLLSNDLSAFLEVETVSESSTPSFLPTVEGVIEILQAEGLSLNETNITSSQNDPLVFELNQVRGKDLDGVERSFDALYFPLNNSFGEMVIEGESIQGIFRLNDLSQALSLPAVMQAQQQTPSDQDSESIDFSVSETTPQDRAAQELARQLAFNQLAQVGFVLSSAQAVRVADPDDLEQVLVLEASLNWPDLDSVSLSFEFNTSRKALYDLKDLNTDQLYFSQIALSQVKGELHDLLQAQQREQLALNQFNQALENPLVTVEPDSIRFLNDTLIQATGITINNLNLTFNAIFNTELNQFTSLTHPLYSSAEEDLETYIPNLVQAYIDDFLTKNNLPIAGNWNIREPLNRIKVSNYEVGKANLAFTLNLTTETFEKVQLKGSEAVVDELKVEQFRRLAQEGE